MCYQYPLDDTAQNIARLLRSNTDKIFVAVSDGLLVGYVHANDYDLICAPHMKNIMGIAVSSEYKQQGIGCALLQKVELWTLETGGLFARPWLFRRKANLSSPPKKVVDICRRLFGHYKFCCVLLCNFIEKIHLNKKNCTTPSNML